MDREGSQGRLPGGGDPQAQPQGLDSGGQCKEVGRLGARKGGNRYRSRMHVPGAGLGQGRGPFSLQGNGSCWTPWTIVGYM